MPLALSSIWVSIVFAVIYLITLYFICRSLPKGNYFFYSFAVMLVAFLLIYNYKYLGNQTSYNVESFNRLVYIISLILYLPILISFINLAVIVLKGKYKFKILTSILCIFLAFILWWVWIIMFMILFLGFIQ